MSQKEHTREPSLHLPIMICFFLSGVAGLMYEIIWIRMIDKIIGSAPFAVAATLTVFMGGLALGSYLAGRRIDLIPDRRGLLRLYGKIELGIGVYGLFLPLMMVMVRPLFAWAYNHLFPFFWVYTLITFAGCALLLILPATLMGATLPILCRFYVTRLQHMGLRTGYLYGLNTCGGALGACLAGFVLIRFTGVWGTNLWAVGINLVVGMAAVALSRFLAPASDLHAQAKQTKAAKKKKDPVPDIEPKQDRFNARWALLIFAFSGFCAMSCEVIWTRLLGLLMGPTTYSFTLVVVTFIIGLALGSFLFGWMGDRIKNVFPLLALTQITASLLALLLSQFLGNNQFFFAKLIYAFQNHFAEMMLAQSLILFFLMLTPTVLWGAAFPLVNKIFARSLPGVGRSIGSAYAMNTVGAILGSFVSGFVMIPLLGKENGLRLVTCLQFSLGTAALAAWLFHQSRRKILHVPLLGLCVLGAWLAVSFPDWNRQVLSYGRYRNLHEMEDDLKRTGWFDAIARGPEILNRYEKGREIVFYGDGIGGFTTVEKLTDLLGTTKYTLLNSGKPDASSHGDRSTQTLLAHIPLIFHPGAEKVMVLGLASGMTAGEVLHYPVKQLDILEINDQVLRACAYFEPWNNGCLRDPRSRVIIQDGRNHLSLTRDKYDVIISEPSNPWMAGLANLYTLDFFQTVKTRLESNGIFVQWIHSYEMDWHTFSMAGRTFRQVFENSVLMTTMTGVGDYLLIGINGEMGLELDAALNNYKFARRSANMRLPGPELFYSLIIAEDLKELFGSGPIHTDNRPLLEFSAPKLLNRLDRSVEEMIARRRSVSEKTKKIINRGDPLNTLLDLLAFSTSTFSPILFETVDLRNASLEQRERYTDIVEAFCDTTFVADYEIFYDYQSRQSCASQQVDKIRRHLEPDDASAFYSLGLVLQYLGNPEETIEAFSKAVSLDPQHVKAYNNLGVALSREGRLKEAEEVLLKALDIKPSHASAYFNLAFIAQARKEKSEAINFLKRGLEFEDNQRAKMLLQELLVSQ